MSSTIHHAFGGFLEGAERVLEKRWVQVIIFTAVLVAAWLLPARIAHAAW